MKRWFLLVVVVLFFQGASQAQPEKFDIATFTPPAGWERTTANGTLSFFNSKAVPGGTVFCQIVLFPSKKSLGAPIDDFKDAWNNIVAGPMRSTVQPKIETTTDDGWNLVTGIANITFSGIEHTNMLVTATRSGKTMSFQVKMLGGDYLPVVSKFFDQLSLNATASTSERGPTEVATNVVGSYTLSDYEFLPPPKWQVQKGDGILRIQSPESGCLIIIFTPQQSSGDLEKDAAGVFETMYRGWQFQKTGDQRYTLSRGFTLQGLEFFMMEGLMGKLAADGSRYDGFEEGAALVIKIGNQTVIVSVRHNTGLFAHNDCMGKYEYWRRFFNSFVVKNAPVAKNSTADAPARIIGKWSLAESGVAVGDYVFAANGNYSRGGGVGSSSTTADSRYEYLHMTTYAFGGDGSYSLAGNKLSLKKRGAATELAQIRFDKVNHAGTGWKDRFHILTMGSSGETESRYEKQGR